ncbi:GFA family protein [uncultured Tateyamaria sp.]|uniref:GFA family protein n=1 Tax=uncultured Tateyamaria sp. TaxID=455651 RepID=UPI00262E435C|nr:GFA family protein [uncultured Tateyamaria sp.]
MSSPENFSLEKGADAITEYLTERSIKRFCSTCGSATWLKNGKHFPEDVVLPMGAIDTFSEELKPQVHVYTADKAEWVEIDRAIPVMS